MKRISLAVLGVLLLTTLGYADDPVVLEEAGCNMCGSLEDLPETLVFATETPEQTYQIILVYRNISEDWVDQRLPMKYAPILVHVKETDDVFVVYTNAEGRAEFDFGAAPGIDLTKPNDFQFTYCHTTFGCAFTECVNGIGINAADRGYFSVDDIPRAFGVVEPAELPDPIAGRPVSTTTTFSPPPPQPGGGAAPAFCFPLALIFALLGGGMYLSGRNPFRGFDLSAPRLHKPYQYSARVRGAHVSITGIMQATGVTGKLGGALIKGLKKGNVKGEMKKATGESSEGASTQVGPGGVLITGAQRGRGPTLRGFRNIGILAKGGMGALRKAETGSAQAQTTRQAIAQALPWMKPLLMREESGATAWQATAAALSTFVEMTSFGVFFRAMDEMRSPWGAERKTSEMLFGGLTSLSASVGFATNLQKDGVEYNITTQKTDENGRPVTVTTTFTLKADRERGVQLLDANGNVVDVTAAGASAEARQAWKQGMGDLQEAVYSIATIAPRINETEKREAMQAILENVNVAESKPMQAAIQQQFIVAMQQYNEQAHQLEGYEKVDESKLTVEQKVEKAKIEAEMANQLRVGTAYAAFMTPETAQGIPVSGGEFEKLVKSIPDMGAKDQREGLYGILTSPEGREFLKMVQADPALAQAFGGINNINNATLQAEALAGKDEVARWAQQLAPDATAAIGRMEDKLDAGGVQTANRIYQDGLGGLVGGLAAADNLRTAPPDKIGEAVEKLRAVLEIGGLEQQHTQASAKLYNNGQEDRIVALDRLYLDALSGGPSKAPEPHFYRPDPDKPMQVTYARGDPDPEQQQRMRLAQGDLSRINGMLGYAGRTENEQLQTQTLGVVNEYLSVPSDKRLQNQQGYSNRLNDAMQTLQYEERPARIRQTLETVQREIRHGGGEMYDKYEGRRRRGGTGVA